MLDLQPLTCLIDLQNMPPSLLTLSLVNEENRRNIDAMKRSAGQTPQTDDSGIEMGAVKLAPEHKQSATSKQGK